MSWAIYLAAAVLEIAGCFAFWAWLRLDKPIWLLVPSILALALFAYLLALTDTAHAGRAYAAYGGIYILSALCWLYLVEGVRPDRWDIAGASLCIVGAAIILWGPRAT